MTCGLYLATRI